MPDVNASGEPCDREGHARFDGEALETGASCVPRLTLQVLNVLEKLPEGLRPVIGRKLDQAWRMEDPDEAERALRRLASSLQEAHPGAAASIREGLEETLTISRLGLSPALIKTFKSTNPIDSLCDSIRVMERNVKNWRSGTMALRWTAAAALEREKRFRRINGHRDLWLLQRALDRHTKEVTSSRTAA